MIKVMGIKNCDTVRKALKWLDSETMDYEFHDFKKDGLSGDLATVLADKIDINTLINKRGTTWRKVDEAVKTAIEAGDKEAAIALMQAEPSVVKRPVWFIGDEGFVAFKQAEMDRIKSLVA